MRHKNIISKKKLQPHVLVDEDLYRLTHIKCDAVVRPTLNEVILGDVAKTDTRSFIQNCTVEMLCD